MSSDDFSTDQVLFSSFTILNVRYRVYFRRGSLIWAVESETSESKIVPIRDIISVNYVHDRVCGCKTVTYAGGDNEGLQGPTVPPPRHDKLEVNYATAASANVWRPVKVVLKHDDYQQVDLFVRTIQLALDSLKRPRRFLAFVNPNSGKQCGERIYRKSVEPILQLANVKTELVITKTPNDSKELIFKKDYLNQFDAILVVGGDGTVSEIINALVRQGLKLAGFEDGNEPRWLPPVPELPLAVIPCGSTDCIAYTMNGTLDQRTAALYAVLGETVGLDVCTVSSSKGLIKCFVSLLGYGFLGDVLETSEKYRWMGPKRYDFSGVLKVIANRRYHCQVRMTLDNRLPGVGPVCHRNCAACDNVDIKGEKKTRYQEKKLASIRALLNDGEGQHEKEKCVTITGKYFWITCANISCACPRSPVGVAPFTHLGDGSMDVILIKPRNPIDILRLLLRSASKNPAQNIYDLPFVETYKVNEMDFHVINKDESPMAVDPETEQGVKSSVWNCDGEIIRDSNVSIANNRQHVQVLTRRNASPNKAQKGLCTSCVEPSPTVS